MHMDQRCGNNARGDFPHCHFESESASGREGAITEGAIYTFCLSAPPIEQRQAFTVGLVLEAGSE